MNNASGVVRSRIGPLQLKRAEPKERAHVRMFPTGINSRGLLPRRAARYVQQIYMRPEVTAQAAGRVI